MTSHLKHELNSTFGESETLFFSTIHHSIGLWNAACNTLHLPIYSGSKINYNRTNMCAMRLAQPQKVRSRKEIPNVIETEIVQLNFLNELIEKMISFTFQCWISQVAPIRHIGAAKANCKRFLSNLFIHHRLRPCERWALSGGRAIESREENIERKRERRKKRYKT